MGKQDMYTLIKTFINLFKSNNYKLDKFYSFINKSNAKDKILLKEIMKCYICYESYLNKENLMDFNDMINLAIEKLENSITVMLSPQGEPLSEQLVLDLAKYDQIIMLCGHYEGFDERIREIIKPKEISIGDFVLTGGELPSLCLIDAVSRKLNGTLGKIESAEEDSFSNGLLEYPQYTKPRDFRGYKVPEVLLNGNHKEINEFRLQQQIERTKTRRPDLYEKYLKNKK